MTCAGVSHHRACAVATEQLTSEQIIVVIMLPGANDFIILELPFCHLKITPFNNLRHAIVDADVIVDVYACVAFVGQDGME